MPDEFSAFLTLSLPLVITLHNTSHLANNTVCGRYLLHTTTNRKMTGRMIGRYTEAALLKRAKEVVEEKGSGSAIFDEEAEKVIPRFYAKGECYISCVSLYILYK